MNVNNLVLGGNVTRDPEVKDVGNSKVAKFGLAVNRRYSVEGEKREETTYMDVDVWGKQAEVVEKYVKKGSSIVAIGEIRLDSWEDKDGNRRSKHYMRAFSVDLGPKRESSESSSVSSDDAQEPVAADVDDDPLF